jgi:hypothetical protein
MVTILITHEIDDLEHWLASPVRKEAFGALGMRSRTFVDPANPTHVGLIVEAPDVQTFMTALKSEEAAAAMASDGVVRDTYAFYFER